MTDLRTLAQAVVDTSEEADRSIFAPAADIAAENAACDLGRALGYPRGADATVSTARAILAALDAERAQGYARALDAVADWAREQLPAAAERD